MILIDTQKAEFNKLSEVKIFDKSESVVKPNGNLLVIGLGGEGAKTVLKLKGMLQHEIDPEDNIEFIMIDSCIPEMEKTIEDSKDSLGFNATEVFSIYRPNLEKMLVEEASRKEAYQNLAKWMSPDMPAEMIGIRGARGNRQIGRLMFSNAYEELRVLIFEKLSMMYKKSAGRRLDVIIVTCTGGGTGSGIISDVAYNIRAYAKSQKMNGFRLGAVLMTPDMLFGEEGINAEKREKLLANSYACLNEISEQMKLENGDVPYYFESNERRLSLKENIFDSAILITGRKGQDKTYIPSRVIHSDVAYFMYKLTSPKYIGGEEFGGGHNLLRDIFFRKNEKEAFKIMSETDYKIPIKEIENISEYEVFHEVFQKFKASPLQEPAVKEKISSCFSELREFINGKPGEEINLQINGLVNFNLVDKPVYKDIKKDRDNIRETIGRDLGNMRKNINGISKNVETKLWKKIEDLINYATEEYGPMGVLYVIGAKEYIDTPEDMGLIKEVEALKAAARDYTPTTEYTRIIESIKQMVAKKLFAFPKAKRETEKGYYDACIKEALATERTILMEGFEDSDLYGDTIRWLRQVAERISDIFVPFSKDLEESVEDLSNESKRILSYMLRDSRQSHLLPSDYVTEGRLEDFRKALVRLYNDNKINIENERPIEVKEHMERAYKNLFAGLGVYSAEKFLYMSFTEGETTLQEMNALFVQASNEKRDAALRKAAESFVKGSREKISRKKLTIIKEPEIKKYKRRKYISLPESMPHFCAVITEILTSSPYNEKANSIAVNPGEMSITEDDIISEIPFSILQNYEDMKRTYEELKITEILDADSRTS